MRAKILEYLFAVSIIATVLSHNTWAKEPPPVLAEPDADFYLLYLPKKSKIEKIIPLRVNADTYNDYAVIGGNGDERQLYIFTSNVNEVDMGYAPAGNLPLEYGMGGTPSVQMQKGVLLVDDLRGGTSALNLRYRYRFEPQTQRLRLIGDDVTYYSRTNQHDAIETSTNRLTGLRLITVRKLQKDGSYINQPVKRSKVSTKPIYMEDTPDPWDESGISG